MKIRAFIALLLFAAQPATADEFTIDTRKSLISLESELTAVSSPRSIESVALGAVHFLRAVEKSLQERYRTNAAFGGGVIDIPVLRVPVRPNPQPDPFQPALVASLFEELGKDMEQARSVLGTVSLGPEDRIIIDIGALWFDVDGNGERGAGEGVLEFLGFALEDGVTGTQNEPTTQELVVHFDAADVEWLAAYTHMLSAVSEVVLAFDPTETIAEVLESTSTMEEIKGDMPGVGYGFLTGNEGFVDAFAAAYGALNRTPDAMRIAAARDHLLNMIDRNRAFWALVVEETDNSLEWIPNDDQDAALGFDLPPGTSLVWLNVLTDAEAILKGDLLVPHWRTDPGGGVNVAELIANPPAFDLVTWVQGAGLVPYMEKGPVVTGENFMRFQMMFAGNAGLYMLLLN